MGNESYQLESGQSAASYEFVSVREKPRREIRKLVQYTEIGKTGIYNLGFGDKLGEADKFDDKVISNNGDSTKVLATVVKTVYDFTDLYPYASILATGSSPARTRLYRIGISNALGQIEKDFIIKGYLEGHWEKFEKNRNYAAFLITKK